MILALQIATLTDTQCWNRRSEALAAVHFKSQSYTC